ncbi:Vacuolar protein sorting-associated protein 70 [Linderina macrospora]|uniref:Vacuolar protein sorting-associated protein 70 n=1 Tax=Linderina macrospora TaxID=4868 RepID=A0ACC1JEM2_9FUNG|nr:Vacuolar protein sorting-associated protein 70 [Linderina macrospora]
MLGEKQPLITTPPAPAGCESEKCQRMYKRIKVGLLAIASAALALHVLGKVFKGCEHDHLTPHTPDFDAGKVFLSFPSTKHLRENLAYYTSGTHVAGINRTQAVYTRDYIQAQGIDAEIVEYYPWMNYPVDQRVALFNATTSEVLFEAGLKEDVIPGDPASEDPNNLPAFHGYSANGNVTGQLVYANYGSLDDFKALKAAGISIKDKVVLVRYGEMTRGLKVYAAGLDGARGVLIYSDPADDGYVQGPVYPEGPWRPESSFQRGSVSLIQIYPGDPLTPGYAATKDAPRLDPNEATNLNRIPSLPLSYRDAEPLLRALKGQGKLAKEVGDNWVGGLTSKGVEYWTGPSELSVNLLNQVEYKITPIQNVIARIEGWSEPNRAVIIGNHRDAWCAGASDPSSGSAAMLELSRGLGKLLKLGWRPRRTIILGSWDAEEYSLIGSTEWVEENQKWLNAEAVAYVNVDGAVGGSEYAVGGSPVLKHLLYEATKQVPYPHSNQTVYDVWLRDSAKYAGGVKPEKPIVFPLGSGSDFTAFMSHAGISSIDMGFGGYGGSYHSNYDSFNWMSKFVDPDFKFHQAMTRLWGLLTIRLADDPVLDLKPTTYAEDLKDYIDGIEAYVASQIPDKTGIDETIAKKFRHLRRAQRNLLRSAYYLEKRLQYLQRVYGEGCQMSSGRRRRRCFELRKSINERVTKLERQFIDPSGIPGREWYKHILVSPGRWMGYDSQIFPALAEAAEDGNWKAFQAYEERAAGLIDDAARFLRKF